VSEPRAEPEPAATAGSGAEVTGPGPLSRMLIRLGALVLIGALLFIFHGVRSYLSPWSQAIINGIVKYTYPHLGQEETTVLLFREDNLRRLKESYPVSYGRHAMVLDALASFRPRAIFVDFVFVDERPGISELHDAICDVRDSGIPVYLAVMAPMKKPIEPRKKSDGTVEPWLFECAVQVSAQMAPAYGASGVLTYAHRIEYKPPKPADSKAPADQASIVSAASASTAKGPVPASEFLPTPAFEMAGARMKQLARSTLQDMEIIWGNGVAPLNQAWMSECSRPGGWLPHLVSIVSDNPLKLGKLRCPYTRTITVAHLLLSSNDVELADAVHDRTVFYGAAFNLTGDRVSSPVFEDMPGVYLHAMAYDNLVTFGDKYKRAERQLMPFSLFGRRFSVPLTLVVDVLLLLVTATIVLLVEEPPPPVQKVRERFTRLQASRKWLVLGLLTALIVVGVVTGKSYVAGFGLLLLMIAITVLDLAPPSERPPESLQGFVVRRLLALVVPVLAVLAFILVDHGLGLEAALLLIVVPGYFVYRVVVGHDLLFAATAMLLVLAAVVLVSPPVNLGPRNVLAYVAFFEAARRLLKHADDVATQYFTLRVRHPDDAQWGSARRFMPALDQVFAVCRRTIVPVDGNHDKREETHGKPAGAPA